MNDFLIILYVFSALFWSVLFARYGWGNKVEKMSEGEIAVKSFIFGLIWPLALFLSSLMSVAKAAKKEDSDGKQETSKT